jgi:hypothetical protein
LDDTTLKSVRRVVAAYVAAGALAALACVSLLGRFPLRFGLGATLIASVIVVATLALFERFAVRFTVRGERVAMSFQDAILIASLLVLSPAIAPIVAAIGAGIGQVLCGRNLLKSTFNVAQETVSVGAAAATMIILSVAGLPLVLAIAPTPIVYALVNHGSVASILSRIDKLPARVIFRERMLTWALAAVILAEATGVAVAMAL